MGCSNSVETEFRMNQIKEWTVRFHKLQLTKNDIYKLLKVFKAVGNGEHDSVAIVRVEIAKIAVYFMEDNSLFMERVFSSYDCSGTATVDFCEFVFAIWNFCLADESKVG